MTRIAAVIIAAAVAFFLAGIASHYAKQPGTAAPVSAGVVLKPASCAPSAFTVIDKTSRIEHERFYITGIVRNDNPSACGVKLSIDVTDKAGHIVATKDDYPALDKNIPPGDTRSFEVMLSEAVTAKATGGGFTVKPVDAPRW